MLPSQKEKVPPPHFKQRECFLNVHVFLLVFLLIFSLAHVLIHSLRQSLAPDCIPLFTSDGLNFYFYALTAHFGQWLLVRHRGRNMRPWQVAEGLIYGQVKKS